MNHDNYSFENYITLLANMFLFICMIKDFFCWEMMLHFINIHINRNNQYSFFHNGGNQCSSRMFLWKETMNQNSIDFRLIVYAFNLICKCQTCSVHYPWSFSINNNVFNQFELMQCDIFHSTATCSQIFNLSSAYGVNNLKIIYLVIFIFFE